MSRWFRHYAGMMRDEKLVRVAIRSKQTVERVVWVWGAILESASEINENGRYELDAGEAAYFLRCADDDILSVLAELETSGRLSQGVVARWSDRQYSSDSSKERQRQYRLRKADAPVHSDDNNHNGDVTPPSRDAELTPQETEADTELEDANASSSSEPEKSAPSAVAHLPTVSEGEVPFFQTDLEEWAKAFPAVDTRQQLAAMRSWLIANPTKRKTKRGMRKFVVSWLDRKQNSGVPPAQNGRSPPAGKRMNALDAYQEIARAKGWTDEPGSIPGSHQNAQRLSAEPSGPNGVVVDLRRGPDWSVGSGDNRDSPALPTQRDSAAKHNLRAIDR